MKKKILMLTTIVTFFVAGVFAQQAHQGTLSPANTNALNPNIERMKVVNEKVAAEKAKVKNYIAPVTQAQQTPAPKTGTASTIAPANTKAAGSKPSKPVKGATAPVPNTTKQTH